MNENPKNIIITLLLISKTSSHVTLPFFKFFHSINTFAYFWTQAEKPISIPLFPYFACLPLFLAFLVPMTTRDEHALDSSKISSTGGIEHAEPSALQKHVMFFDMNKDGIIYPSETFQGFRKIGCGILLSAFASLFINLGLSRKSRPGKGLSLSLPIEVKNIKHAKHGSDSGVYDTEGRFVASKFEEIFDKHARTNKNGLTSDELHELLVSNRQPKDYAGWLGAYSEWKILYILCKDKQGMLPKETVRAVYDGSLFEKMAKEHASKKKA